MDALDYEDKHYQRRKTDLENHLYKTYDKIDDAEKLLVSAKAKKRSLLADKITGDNIYKALVFFDKLYAQMNELCLKRLFYSRVDNGVPLKVFNSKRKSHLIKKDLWKNVKPVIKKYANDSGEDLTTIDIVEGLLEEINELDKNGDNFRYPTSYSLEYRFDNKELDISNVYTYLKAIINFLDGCDSMLDAIADYQSEIKAEYEAEMRASLDWY